MEVTVKFLYFMCKCVYHLFKENIANWSYWLYNINS